MPDPKAPLVRRFLTSVEQLDRLRDLRRDRVQELAAVQVKIDALTTEITTKRQQVRQIATQLKPDLDNI